MDRKTILENIYEKKRWDFKVALSSEGAHLEVANG